MITFSLIVTLLLGGAGTVAAAQNDLPGDVLYPIKIVSEVIAEKFALSDQAKVKVEAKLAERRANEVIVLKARAKAEVQVEGQPEKELSPKIKQRILKANERLEFRIEKTKARVEALKAKDTKGTLKAVAVLQAKIERMEAALEKKHENSPSGSEKKPQKDITIELDSGGAVEIELEVPQLQEKKRPFDLLKRKEK